MPPGGHNPLWRKKPYNAIRFTRMDGQGTALYRVAGDPQETGAPAALRRAFERFGAHCFHCGQWMPPQPLSQRCTRDHLRPRRDGGGDLLHNLVFACGPCNRAKGGSNLISFRAEAGADYMRALESHLAECIAELVKSVMRPG